MRRLVILLVGVISLNSLVWSQDIRGPIANPAPGVLDGVYVQEHVPTKKVVPYEFIREADVAWAKRVWRVIDMREKFNHPLHYPLDDFQDGMNELDLSQWLRNPTRWSLWTIIRYHIMTGDLTLYSPFHPDWQVWQDGDLFKYPYVPETYGMGPGGNFFTDSVFRKSVKGMEYLGYEIFDPNPSPIKSVVYPTDDSIDANGMTVYYPNEFRWYSARDIVQYHVKEDWFFDKERSVLDVRIIGICPVVYRLNSKGEVEGLKELFWLYFPECRYVFQNFFVQNKDNDAQRMSFDDLFWKRMFQSYIMKSSNIYDREIDSYKAGVDALLEAERIKEQIFTFEHDLWNF